MARLALRLTPWGAHENIAVETAENIIDFHSALILIVQVIGQTQDLMDLQRILRRSETKLGDQAQQNLTRCARFLLHYWLQHATTCLPAARSMVGVAPVMLSVCQNRVRDLYGCTHPFLVQ